MTEEDVDTDKMGYEAHPVFDKIEDGEEGHWIPDIDHLVFPVEIEVVYGRSRVDRVLLHNTTFKNPLELKPKNFVEYIQNQAEDNGYPRVSIENPERFKEMEVEQ